MTEEKTIEWIIEKECSRMVEQRLLPYEYKKVDIRTSDEMFNLKIKRIKMYELIKSLYPIYRSLTG